MSPGITRARCVRDGDKVLQGETLVFTVKATAGYKLIEAVAEGDSFDCVVDNEDGSKSCTVYALGENLTVGARAKKLHRITTLDAANGAISATPRVAAAGDTVTITVTPDNNYQVKSLSATYRDGENNEESLTISADYRFTMPDADVEVSATFEYARWRRLGRRFGGSHLYRHDWCFRKWQSDRKP